MNAEFAQIVPAMIIFLLSLGLTASCLWAAGKLAPWFIGKGAEAPSLRSYFLEPLADTDLTSARIITTLIAVGLITAVLLAMACAVRFGGVTLL